MFDLTRPCVDCPFRKDRAALFDLPAERIREIAEAPAFQCHKTVDYSGDAPRAGDRAQQCAGLMAILRREGRPNQIMQVGERLGAFDPEALDPRREAFDTLAEVTKRADSP